MQELTSPKNVREMLKTKVFREYLKELKPAHRKSTKLDVAKRFLKDKYGYPVNDNTVNLEAMFVLQDGNTIIHSNPDAVKIAKLMKSELEEEFSFTESVADTLSKAGADYLVVLEDGFYACIYDKLETNRCIATIRFFYYGNRLEIMGFEDEYEAPIENPVAFFEYNPFDPVNEPNDI